MTKKRINRAIRGDVRPLQRAGTQGVVYFIGARSGYHDEGRAPVKIGFSTDVNERLRQLQTASPEHLKILALVPGTQSLEAHIHERVAGAHIRGEWYELDHDDIACVMSDLYEDLAWGIDRAEAA